MNKYIKLYEEYVENVEISLQREIDVTIRFLVRENVKTETLQRKIEQRFIESIKPPFTYSDITFYSFDIDHISDIPLGQNRFESEYGIKAKLVFDDVELDDLTIDKMIKRGITSFLKLEEDSYFLDDIESSTIVSLDYI